ncbi:hypothetical protein SNEBB_000280 [Seison nebaliae]|nr:hypothetical protein SNEBB_000280 [Seison nebaliae]
MNNLPKKCQNLTDTSSEIILAFDSQTIQKNLLSFPQLSSETKNGKGDISGKKSMKIVKTYKFRDITKEKVMKKTDGKRNNEDDPLLVLGSEYHPPAIQLMNLSISDKFDATISSQKKLNHSPPTTSILDIKNTVDIQQTTSQSLSLASSISSSSSSSPTTSRKVEVKSKKLPNRNNYLKISQFHENNGNEELTDVSSLTNLLRSEDLIKLNDNFIRSEKKNYLDLNDLYKLFNDVTTHKKREKEGEFEEGQTDWESEKKFRDRSISTSQVNDKERHLLKFHDDSFINYENEISQFYRTIKREKLRKVLSTNLSESPNESKEEKKKETLSKVHTRKLENQQLRKIPRYNKSWLFCNNDDLHLNRQLNNQINHIQNIYSKLTINMNNSVSSNSTASSIHRRADDMSMKHQDYHSRNRVRTDHDTSSYDGSSNELIEQKHYYHHQHYTPSYPSEQQQEQQQSFQSNENNNNNNNNNNNDNDDNDDNEGRYQLQEEHYHHQHYSPDNLTSQQEMHSYHVDEVNSSPYSNMSSTKRNYHAERQYHQHHHHHHHSQEQNYPGYPPHHQHHHHRAYNENRNTTTEDDDDDDEEEEEEEEDDDYNNHNNQSNDTYEGENNCNNQEEMDHVRRYSTDNVVDYPHYPSHHHHHHHSHRQQIPQQTITDNRRFYNANSSDEIDCSHSSQRHMEHHHRQIDPNHHPYDPNSQHYHSMQHNDTFPYTNGMNQSDSDEVHHYADNDNFQQQHPHEQQKQYEQYHQMEQQYYSRDSSPINYEYVCGSRKRTNDKHKNDEGHYHHLVGEQYKQKDLSCIQPRVSDDQINTGSSSDDVDEMKHSDSNEKFHTMTQQLPTRERYSYTYEFDTDGPLSNQQMSIDPDLPQSFSKLNIRSNDSNDNKNNKNTTSSTSPNEGKSHVTVHETVTEEVAPDGTKIVRRQQEQEEVTKVTKITTIRSVKQIPIDILTGKPIDPELLRKHGIHIPEEYQKTLVTEHPNDGDLSLEHNEDYIKQIPKIYRLINGKYVPVEMDSEEYYQQHVLPRHPHSGHRRRNDEDRDSDSIVQERGRKLLNEMKDRESLHPEENRNYPEERGIDFDPDPNPLVDDRYEGLDHDPDDMSQQPQYQQQQNPQDSLYRQPQYWRNPNLAEVIEFLSDDDDRKKANAAAYLQHLCYNDDEVKTRTRVLDGISALVKLLSHRKFDVHRNSCGALRNLSYGKNNDENKREIKRCNGIESLVRLLVETNDNSVKEAATAVLWNLSGCEETKKPIMIIGLAALTERIIVPLCSLSIQRLQNQNYAFPTVLRNAVGILRNCSSTEDEIRSLMRHAPGLVESLLQVSKAACNHSVEIHGKTLENCFCVLRNLAFRAVIGLSEATDGENTGDESTLPLRGIDNQRKHKERSKMKKMNEKNLDRNDKSNSRSKSRTQRKADVNYIPRPGDGRGGDLWTEEVVRLCLHVLRHSQNPDTMEAACGCIQNLAAYNWSPSGMIRQTVRREKGLMVICDLLNYQNDSLASVAAITLRNLAIDPRNKELIGKGLMKYLIDCIPTENQRKFNDKTLCNVLACINEILKDKSQTLKRTHFARNFVEEGGVERLHRILMSRNCFSSKVMKYTAYILSSLWKRKDMHELYEKHGFTEKHFINRSFELSQPDYSPINTLHRPRADIGGKHDQTMRDSSRKRQRTEISQLQPRQQEQQQHQQKYQSQASLDRGNLDNISRSSRRSTNVHDDVMNHEDSLYAHVDKQQQLRQQQQQQQQKYGRIIQNENEIDGHNTLVPNRNQAHHIKQQQQQQQYVPYSDDTDNYSLQSNGQYYRSNITNIHNGIDGEMVNDQNDLANYHQQTLSHCSNREDNQDIAPGNGMMNSSQNSLKYAPDSASLLDNVLSFDHDENTVAKVINIRGKNYLVCADNKLTPITDNEMDELLKRHQQINNSRQPSSQPPLPPPPPQQQQQQRLHEQSPFENQQLMSSSVINENKSPSDSWV